MDKDKKIQLLREVLQEWLKYSKLWNQVEVRIITKFSVERVKSEIRKNSHGEDYLYTDQYTERIPPTEYIRVRRFDPKLPIFECSDHETIEFPMVDLDRRIEHYQNKVKYLKEKSNEK